MTTQEESRILCIAIPSAGLHVFRQRGNLPEMCPEMGPKMALPDWLTRWVPIGVLRFRIQP